ncbi:MAG: hypothetical protein JWM98_2382 [Thermoleophilia bacterium]|nr:hypothetical protein [Thermoleophilia bacterium]
MRRRAPRTGVVAIALVAIVVVGWPLFLLLRRARAAATVDGATPAGPRAEAAPSPVPARPPTPFAAAASTAPEASAGWMGGLRLRGVRSTAFVCLSLLVLVGVPTTWATLTDQVTVAQVGVTAGSVLPPTGMAAAQTATAARVTWAAPASGLAPDGYKVYRSLTSGSYSGALGTTAASPYDDASAVECTPYFYKATSTRVNLESVASATEASVTVDRTAPIVTAANAHVYFTPPSMAPVKDFVRVAAGGVIEAYAQVTDNCSPTGSGLTVTFNFPAPFNVSGAAATFGSYSVAGDTYNYKYTVTPAARPANTVPQSWTVTAVDAKGNAATGVAATPAVGDGVGPTLTRGEVVSGYTNFLYNNGDAVDDATEIGEVVTTPATDALVKSAGFRVYGNFADASGVDSANATTNVLRSATTTPLAATPASTNGLAWAWSSAAVVANVATAASTVAVPVTATDVLGNVGSPTNVSVEIDNTPIGATSTCAQTGNGSGTLNVGDGTDLNFLDTVWPASFRSTWDGTAASATAVLRDGGTGTDYFAFNTDFAMSLFQGVTNANAMDLGSKPWVGANVNVPSTTIAMSNRTTLRIAYGAPATAVTNQNKTTTSYFGATLRDAAGNPSTAFSETCVSNAW